MSTPTTALPSHVDPGTVTRQLLDAITRRDEPTLLALFAPDVWLRVMLVREVVEEHEAVSALARFHGWFGTAAACEVVRAVTHPAASRHFLSYRFVLRPPWAPEVWHTIEQSGYARVRDGRVSRLDLVCTGYVPSTDG